MKIRSCEAQTRAGRACINNLKQGGPHDERMIVLFYVAGDPINKKSGISFMYENLIFNNNDESFSYLILGD